MNLRTLIPDADTVNAPLALIVGDDSSGLTGLANRLEGQDLSTTATALGDLFQEQLATVFPGEGSFPFSEAIGTLSSLSQLSASLPPDLLSGLQGPLAEVDEILTRIPALVASITTTADEIERARTGDVAPTIE